MSRVLALKQMQVASMQLLGNTNMTCIWLVALLQNTFVSADSDCNGLIRVLPCWMSSYRLALH